MDLNKTYEIERTKWDAVSSAKAQKNGIARLRPEEDFVQYSLHSSTHVGVVEFLGDLHGKRVLEFGCGTGTMSVLMAKSGADVTAFDLSPNSVEIARKRAEINDLSDRVHLHVCAGEDLPFPDEDFDIIFGKAVLHHLNVSLSQRHLYRVLKPGGKGAFIEPMGMNPFLSFARDHLPYPGKNPRGADKPLNYDEIRAWGQSFKEFRYREIQLVSMLQRGLGVKGRVPSLTRLDDWLLAAFPFLRRFCRYVVLYMVK